MRVAPGGDGVVAVGIGHRDANDEQQHLAQRIGHTPSLARVGRKEKWSSSATFLQRQPGQDSWRRVQNQVPDMESRGFCEVPDGRDGATGPVLGTSLKPD